MSLRGISILGFRYSCQRCAHGAAIGAIDPAISMRHVHGLCCLSTPITRGSHPCGDDATLRSIVQVSPLCRCKISQDERKKQHGQGQCIPLATFWPCDKPSTSHVVQQQCACGRQRSCAYGQHHRHYRHWRCGPQAVSKSRQSAGGSPQVVAHSPPGLRGGMRCQA